MIRVYTQLEQGQRWLERYRGCAPLFVCVLGFTETALQPRISAAGATPQDRKYTAIADAEFLVNGPCAQAQYPLPPLVQGASPVFITRAILNGQQIPLRLFSAGLPTPPTVDHIDLGGQPARCVSTGAALPLQTVQKLLQQGLQWGHKLAVPGRYLICSECVVGGTTTALALLTGLGIAAQGKINSSHPICNHAQKEKLVQTGLKGAAGVTDPLALVAAVGDPMQIVVAGMAIAASQVCGVLLAGGTQMLAVYALANALVTSKAATGPPPANQPETTVPPLRWNPEQMVVGTTRWVAEDPSGDTVGLAEQIGTVPLLASQLNFHRSKYPQLQAYEEGYVKEGVGAGGCAIAASLYQQWQPIDVLEAVESLLTQHYGVMS